MVIVISLQRCYGTTLHLCLIMKEFLSTVKCIGDFGVPIVENKKGSTEYN